VQIGTTDATTNLFIGAGSPATTTFSGALTGPGSLELDGGRLTLTGAGNNIGGDLTLCACDLDGLTIKGGSFVVGGLTSVEGGTLTVSNGGTLSTDALGVGSNMIITGAGSTVTVTTNTGIGVGGPGTLTISGGGTLNSQGATEIDSFIGTPNVTVTGAASTWNVSAKMTVGNGAFGGPGSLTISNGGAVNATGSFMEIGDQATGTSQVTVTGVGSVLNVTNRMAVGDASGEPGSGPGSLTIANGGVVNATGPFLDIGDAFTGTSLVTVTGTGSTLNVTTSLAVGTQCGCEVGTLTIAGGAVVNSPVFTGVGAGSTLNLGTGGLAGSIVTPTIVDSTQVSLRGAGARAPRPATSWLGRQ
jgi:fibronectin-binding autotransporter adhesin